MFSEDATMLLTYYSFLRMYIVYQDKSLSHVGCLARRMLIMWDVGKARYSGLLMRDVGYFPRFWMLIYQRTMGIRLIYWCDNKLNMSFLQEALKIVIIEGKSTFRKPLI